PFETRVLSVTLRRQLRRGAVKASQIKICFAAFQSTSEESCFLNVCGPLDPRVNLILDVPKACAFSGSRAKPVESGLSVAEGSCSEIQIASLKGQLSNRSEMVPRRGKLRAWITNDGFAILPTQTRQ